MLVGGERRTDRFAMQWRLVAPGVVLVIGCGIPTAVGYSHTAAQHQAQHAADVHADQHLQLARELPATPLDVLVALVEFVGEGGSTPDTLACLMFSPTAAVQFAASAGAISCPTAVEVLHSRVTDRGEYINAVAVPPRAWSASGDTATVNGCDTTWNNLPDSAALRAPGPLPGHLTLTRQDSQGWLITDYQGC